MKFTKRTDPFKKILWISILAVFGVSLLAILYKGIRTSTENRSKAAEIQTVYKSWEFNGNTAEGWLGNNINRIVVKDGLLTGTITSDSNVYFINKTGAITLPRGSKTIILRMSVSAQTPVPTTPKNSALRQTTSVTNAPVILKINYFSSGIKRDLPPARGTANGVFADYMFTFTDIADIKIDSLQLELSSVTTGATVRLDNIRLLGMPVPTPTIACKKGVNTFVTESSCTPDNKTVRYATYQCVDGKNGRLGNGTCQTPQSLSVQAQKICQNSTSCPPVPTRSGTPTPTTPSPRPVPPTVTPVRQTGTPTATPCVTVCDSKGKCYETCPQTTPTNRTVTPTPMTTPAPVVSGY
jgi:hypothetical protein